MGIASGSSTSTTTRLAGSRLTWARIIWGILIVSGLATYLFAQSIYFQGASLFCFEEPCPPDQSPIENVEVLTDLGVTATHVKAVFSIADSLVLFIAIGFCVLVITRRFNDWLALMTSALLFLFGVTFGPAVAILVDQYPVLFPIVVLFQTLGFSALPAIFLIFPDGRFVPRWSRWLLLIIAILFFVSSIYTRTQLYLFPPFFPLMGLSLLVTAGMQVYRFRRVASPVQRQQTKWVVLGTSIAVFLTSIGAVPGMLFPDILFQTNAIESFIYQGIRVLFFTALPLALIPLSIGISLIRYRLWDVDFYVNRSVVYGVLVLLAGPLFLGLFFVLREGLDLILGNERAMLSAVIASGAVVASFNPARRWITHQVDKRLYGIDLDYTQAIRDYEGRGRKIVIARPQSTFGNYHQLELLGRGGMGEVYLADDPERGHKVAIKVLPSHLEAQDEYSKRFTREAQTISKLDHPNIVKLYSGGVQDNSPYMVMEYINGYDLSDSLKEHGKLSLDQLLPILEAVASALDYAHRQGIVHRDIKPSNIMVDGNGRAVLMDFGIARIANALTQLTGTGGMVGTMDYISPEQIQGADDLDHRADIYSLGVMTYQLLTGELPFKKNNPGALVMAHLMEPPPDAQIIRPDLTDAVAHAMIKAMSKKPDERFDSAGALVEAMH